MAQKTKDHQPGKLKQFILSLMVKIDKKMEEKSKSSSCCCKSTDKTDKKCCS